MTAAEMARKRWQGVPFAERQTLMKAAAAKASEVRKAKKAAREAEAQLLPEAVEA